MNVLKDAADENLILVLVKKKYNDNKVGTKLNE